MSQSAIFGPFLATIALTFVVWVYMYVRRIHFLTANAIDSRDLTSPRALEDLTPREVANPSDNLKNLFEIPVLFYALCLYLFVSGQVDGVHLAVAWIFVGFRVLHSAVHCTVNVVIVRFYLYALSTLALWFMAARAILRFVGS